MARLKPEVVVTPRALLQRGRKRAIVRQSLGTTRDAKEKTVPWPQTLDLYGKPESALHPKSFASTPFTSLQLSAITSK